MIKNKTVKIHNIFIILIVFLFVLIIAKLIYVAVSPKVDGMDLKAFASSRNTKKEILVAPRGTLYDKSGEILAQNVNSYTVIAYLNPKRTTNKDDPKHVIDKENTAIKLSPLINMTKERILELLNMEAYQVELGPGGRGLTELVKDEIKALDLPGIDFVSSTKRYYPNADFLSYTLGYAKTDNEGHIIGELGLELYYNDILTGKNGTREFQQDMYGYQIANTASNTVEAKAGDNIYLTIDTNIQMFTEEAIKTMKESGMEWGTATVMNAKTGEILGVSSYPSFDPNIKNITSYTDPFVSYVYEPGSTMKIFSFMAAMEAGIYNGDEIYHSGEIKIDDKKVNDWNNVGWGDISFDKGFHASSNVAATILAQKLGRQKLKDFYESLGFGNITGINLPGEQYGAIDFKYNIEVANAAFGQGMSSTTIELLQALTSLANDGEVVKPYLIKKIVDGNTKKVKKVGKTEKLNKVASTETINKMKKLMYGVVNEKDGYSTGNSYIVDGLNVIGKTGTAQIASKNGGYLSGEYNVIRSFAGLFPYEDPEIIVYTTASKLASPKALTKATKNLMEDTATYYNIRSDYVENEKSTTVLKSYVNKKTSKVKEEILSNKLYPIIIGDGDTIISQYPKSGVKLNENEKVFLLSSSKELKHPNMIGWSRADVNSYANMLGLDVIVSGYGYVKSTNIPSNSIIDKSFKIEVTLEPIYKKEEVKKSS